MHGDEVKTPTVDFEGFHAVFVELDEFVTSDPALGAFGEAVTTLREQARQLTLGVRDLPIIARSSAVIPDRVRAGRLVEIISHLPPMEGGELLADRLALARLLGNLVNGITHAIFSQFPELVPRTVDRADVS